MPELKILVAIDGSTLSETSLRYLPLLKPLGGLKVRLVSVVETYSDAEGLKGADEHFEREARLLSAYADRVAGEQAEKTGIAVEAQVKVGRADEQIEAAAEEFGANLILLTTHGRSGIGRWAIGSVADKVLRTAKAPVLVFGPHVSEHEPPAALDDVMAPLDGSEHAESALRVADEWAQGLKARLHLVRVVTLPAVTYEPGSAATVPDLFTVMQDSAQAYMERIKSEAKAPEVKTDILVGPIADQLTNYATENSVDLVVMTSRGRRGLLRSVLGSVTDRMLRGPAPILVLPSD